MDQKDEHPISFMEQDMEGGLLPKPNPVPYPSSCDT